MTYRSPLLLCSTLLLAALGGCFTETDNCVDEPNLPQCAQRCVINPNDPACRDASADADAASMGDADAEGAPS